LLALTITVNAKNKHHNKHAQNKHANKHAQNKHAKKNACCQSRGSPGWNDMFYGFIGQPNDSFENFTTPQECCLFCVNDPTCVEWLFYPYTDSASGFICDRVYNGSVSSCGPSTIAPSDIDEEGGIIRCSDSDSSN
ncbi:14884_t:CDS:1, partial [Dentiscutata heterogama]